MYIAGEAFISNFEISSVIYYTLYIFSPRNLFIIKRLLNLLPIINQINWLTDNELQAHFLLQCPPPLPNTINTLLLQLIIIVCFIIVLRLIGLIAYPSFCVKDNIKHQDMEYKPFRIA